jgi:hypothetical protein
MNWLLLRKIGASAIFNTLMVVCGS